MGFRSNFITEDLPVEWPIWFVEKYNDYIYKSNIYGKAYGSISSKYECKRYMGLSDLENDIQLVLRERGNLRLNRLVIIWLHECGGIEKVEIYKDKIIHGKPTAWKITEEGDGQSCVSYDCSGCCDLDKIEIINNINEDNIKSKEGENLIEKLSDLTRELASLAGYNDKFAKQRRKYLKRQIKLFEDTIKNKLIDVSNG